VLSVGDVERDDPWATAALVSLVLLVILAVGLSLIAVLPVPGSETVQGWLQNSYTAIEGAVESATGIVGLAVIFVYSFLIAFILPLPSEVVLAAPLKLPVPYAAELAIIIVVSGAGKALGSLFAFHLGQEAKESGPVIRFLRRSRFDVVEWSEDKTVELAQRYGYVGLALALCVPGFPDTISIYAFSVLEEDYVKFALATFAGSAGRLLVFLGIAEAALAIV
jgi:membrane protein YqaA with SNARE-associated domain